MGFQVSGLYFFGSGARFAPTAGGDRRNRGSATNSRLRADGSIVERNSLVGKSIHRVDFRFSKTFPVGDRVRVQLRIEALNATNYTLFGVGNMVLTPTNAQFMRLNNIDSSTVMKPRDIQIGARVTF